MNLQKIIKYLLLVFLFLLPWQTRWIYSPALINGSFWEYGTLSFYATELLLWLIIFLFIFERLLNKKRIEFLFNFNTFKKKRIRLLFIVLFLSFLALILLNSISFEIAHQYIIRVIGVFSLGIILISYCNGFENKISNLDNSLIVDKNKKQFIFSIWLGGVLQGVLALQQFFSQNIVGNKWFGIAPHKAKDLGVSVIEFGIERWIRAYGSFGWPNILGIFLAIILILGIWLYIKTENLFFKLLITFGQLFILSGLILSFSRGAWLSAIVGIFVLIFLVFKKQEEFRYEIIKQVFFYIMIIILFFITLQPLFVARFDTNNRVENMSIKERISQYQEFKEILDLSPIFGIGPGNYTLALYQKNPNLKSWEYQPIHNIYLLILAEWGALGLYIFLLFLFFIFLNIIKNNIYFLPLFVVFLVFGFFDHAVMSMYFGMTFFGVIMAFSFNFKNS